MKIAITIEGDTVADIARQIVEFGAALGGGSVLASEGAPAALDIEPDTVEPEKETKKTTRKRTRSREPEPEETPEGDEEAESPAESPEDGEEASPEGEDPEKAWKAASDRLLKFWTNGGDEGREAVKGLLKEFKVTRFADIPKEDGLKLLAAAEKIGA